MYAGGSNSPYAPDAFLAPAATAAPAVAAPGTTNAWKDGEFSFHDLLDTINPLQHIPVVGAIYRWLTDDKPGNVAQVVGDTLYGGPVGLGTSLVSLAFRQETGEEPGEMAMAALTGSGGKPATGTAVAAAPASPAPTPAGQPAAPASASSAALAAADAPAPQATPTLPPAPTTAPAAPPPPTAAAFFQKPIPLFKSATPAAGTAPVANAPSAAEKTFLAQNATFQRATSQRALPPGRQITAPIPLQLTGQAMPAHARPPLAVIPPAGIPASAPQPLPGSPPAAALPQNAPVDVPQRMLEALDKYTQMQQQPRGGQVDVSP